MADPLDYESTPPDHSATRTDWLKVLWPWALMAVGFFAALAYLLVDHRGE